MPSDRERGGLVGVKRPLVEAAPVTDPAAERTVLPIEVTGAGMASATEAAHPERQHAAAPGPAGGTGMPSPEELTKPATFHLPIGLLQRLRATCRIKNTTMVDFVRKAIEEALEKRRPTEDEIRKLLGG
jgi:hypothetical protein